MKRFQQIMQSAPVSAPKNLKFNDMDDNFDIPHAEEKLIIDKIKAKKISNLNKTQVTMIPPTQQTAMVVKQDSRLQPLTHSFAEKFKSQSIQIDEKEKKIISDEISRVTFPHAVQNLL